MRTIVNIRAQVAPEGDHVCDHYHGTIVERWDRKTIKALHGKQCNVFLGFPHHHPFIDKYAKDREPVGTAMLVATKFGLEADLQLNRRGVGYCQQYKLHAADAGIFTPLRRTLKGLSVWRMSEIQCIGLTTEPMLKLKPISVKTAEAKSKQRKPNGNESKKEKVR